MNAVPPGAPPTAESGETPDEVHASRETQGSTVQGRRGARSFRLGKREKRKPKPEERKTPPDPSGRGRSLDLRG